MSDRTGRVVSLGKVAGAAVERLVQQRSSQQQVAPVVALPDMPEDLAHQVAVVAGRARFGDFSMTVEATFDPLAAAYAEQERIKLAPASPDRICRWLMMLAEMLGNRAPKLSDVVMQMTCRTLARDLPVVCWEDDTLMTVLLTETHWPSIARLKELLGPLADEARRSVGALDAIAKADPAGQRFRAGPARKSTEVYDPGPATVSQQPRLRSMRERGADDFDPKEAVAVDQASRRSVKNQLAAFGGVGDTDLLAARRKGGGQ